MQDRLHWFWRVQFAKFGVPKNQAKSDWRDMKPYELLQRLEAEVVELRMALLGTIDRRRDGVAAIHECADVANFAFMLADNLRALAEGPPPDYYGGPWSDPEGP